MPNFKKFSWGSMPPDPPTLFTLKRMQWPYQSKIVGAGPVWSTHLHFLQLSGVYKIFWRSKGEFERTPRAYGPADTLLENSTCTYLQAEAPYSYQTSACICLMMESLPPISHMTISKSYFKCSKTHNRDNTKPHKFKFAWQGNTWYWYLTYTEYVYSSSFSFVLLLLYAVLLALQNMH